MAPVTKKSKENANKRSSNSKASAKPAKKARISVDSSDEDELDNTATEEVSSKEDALDDVISDDDEEEQKEDLEDEDKDDDDKTENNKATGENASSHVEQRKLLKERKMQRKGGSEVQHIKSLWERLRVKTPPMPRPVREKLSNEIWELAKDCISDLVLKHDASRVVQTLVKYSSKERRDQVVNALKGKYYLLATSAYGKYLLVKLLHYGSKQSRQLIIDELHGTLRKLMRHREGAYVVEDLFVLYATNEQRQQMIKEFWGSEYAFFRESHKDLTIEEVCESSTEKRNIIARNLITTITASVEKGSTGFQILHAAMREYVKIASEKEITEFIELLQEQLAELVHTPEGADVACTLIAKANAKERKALIKNLKNHADKLIKNEHGNMVFITLLLTVDDTVLVFKSFGPSIKEIFSELVIDKFGRRPLLYILLGLDGRFFSPILKKELERYIKMSEATSKKPIDTKRAELLNKFAPLFVSSVSKSSAEILTENLGSQFISELLLNDDLYEQLSEKEIKNFNSIIENIMITFKGDIIEEDHPIHRPFSTRLLRGLIQGGKWNNKEKQIIPLSNVEGLGTPFAAKFYDDIIDSSNLLDWINNRDSAFTIVAIYETLSKSKNEGKQFLTDLKSVLKNVEADESNKGAQLLIKLAK
ncbi:hypothetical protein TPHA_0P01090 [Tetrapisispora phaffii CBS 4417]|uniref:PUM-HD domain-containing protein n=1 Tax=Tetrapisispora phaffii (strain ATCC 24235 / CBS 4417 / NBRC 1672 / NRRL Y-8282 / UCD 70-5) TaxID=1071381 RepID=G8C289_TETPH|nr:pumilio-family RNA binding domain-containing protein TPHA_0P01090 [Tetrapisispora phaffii CBS 4417]CCE66267.1 hypothetical protein TPHA_0P01090 [Tetrapisispora phaffii CBS 4417]